MPSVRDAPALARLPQEAEQEMLHLTEISLQRADAVEATLLVDPLVAGDLDYCLKTWMRERPGLACRPWRATTLRDGVRIAGWRRESPDDGGNGAYVGSRAISFRPGERLTFATRFIALRRNPRTRRDAADGYQNPAAAYEAWLKERLIDISSAAATDSVTIESHVPRCVLRKTTRKRLRTRVQQEVIPVVDATVEMTVKDTTKLEQWLLIGVGPQKGFGYGAFLPVPGREPILSLFGAAQPPLMGRLTVHHAIAQPTIGLDGSQGTGLPPGTRRDAVTTNPALSDLLGEEDRQLWARQGALVSELSEANRRLEDARRILGRARRAEGASLKGLEQALAEAERNVVRIKEKPEFQHAVQRPIPQKQAAPAGIIYDHRLDITKASPEEMGLLLAALQAWNLNPRIGGGATTGYGYIRGDYMIERLAGEGPRREWRWQPAGTVTIGGEGGAIASEDPEITSARAAWAELEGSLRTRTTIFGS